MNHRVNPIYAQHDMDHKKALEEFEARKASFFAMFPRQSDDIAIREMPDFNCDCDEEEIDEKIQVGETVLDERLAMIFRHNLHFYGAYRVQPQSNQEQESQLPSHWEPREMIRADLDPVYQFLNMDNDNPIDNPDYFYVNLTFSENEDARNFQFSYYIFRYQRIQRELIDQFVLNPNDELPQQDEDDEEYEFL